jgi:hypothetical protein
MDITVVVFRHRPLRCQRHVLGSISGPAFTRRNPDTCIHREAVETRDAHPAWVAGLRLVAFANVELTEAGWRTLFRDGGEAPAGDLGPAFEAEVKRGGWTGPGFRIVG